MASTQDSEPRLEDEDSLTELMLACQRCEVGRVKELLSTFNDPTARSKFVNQKSPKFQVSALLLAAYNGVQEIVQDLLDSGADISASNSEGDSSILLSIYSGQFFVLKLLMQTLASRAQPSSQSSSPPFISAEENFSLNDFQEIDLSASDVQSALWSALRQNSAEGMTCLMYAVEGGHVTIVHWLLSLARHLFSLSSHHPSCIPMSDFVNIRNVAGSTALHFAISSGSHDIFVAIMESGADVGIVTEDGFSPLLLAVQEGDVEMTRQLLQHGADPNVRDGWSLNSPLFLAVERGHMELVHVLLECGGDRVDVSAPNRESMTPLMVARLLKHTDLIALLEEREQATKTKNTSSRVPASTSTSSTSSAPTELQSSHSS